MRAIVCDLFHTLVDPGRHAPVGIDRIVLAARHLGIDEEALRTRWDELEEDRTRGLTPPNAELFADASGRDPDDAVVLDAVRRYGAPLDEALLRPDPSTRLALDAMDRAGLRLAVLSNTERRDVAAWPESSLAARFAVAVFSCDIHALKPEPVAYEVVLEGLELPAGDCVFVGDGGSDELRGAKRQGFGLVVRTTEYVDRGPGGEDAVVARLGEVLDLV